MTCKKVICLLKSNNNLERPRIFYQMHFSTFQEKGFEIYSEYCNNHPHAMAELKTLGDSNKYKQFFEVGYPALLNMKQEIYLKPLRLSTIY